MKSLLSIHSFSMQLLLGFVTLIVLTTLSAGAPAFWLTRTQLERQAWAQVEAAQRATQSLLLAEQDRLRDQLDLLAARPTLQQLMRQNSAEELLLYLADFQQQSGFDLLTLCTLEQATLASNQVFELCGDATAPGFVLIDGRPAMLARQAVVDDETGEPVASAVAVIWLEVAFLQQLAEATGVEHSLLTSDGQRLTSTFAPPQTQVDDWQTRVTESVASRIYYSTYNPLPPSPSADPIISEVALAVDELVATERRAYLILAISTLTVALLGSLFSIWFVRRMNAPLQRLTSAAERIGAGELMTAIPLFTNPTEVKTLATALHRSQASMLDALEERSEVGERLNALLQALVEGVVTYDTDGRVTFWSEGAAQMLGWSPAEALGQHVDHLFPLAEEATDAFLTHVPAMGQKDQLRILTRYGKPLALALTVSQLIPPGGDTVQVALVFRDVTEEDALRRLRSYFLANISHEFFTPLSTLNASIELLLDEGESFTLAEVRQLLRPTYVSLLSLQSLIDNLLESSRIEAGQFTLRPRLFHIHEAIENAVNIARPLLDRRSQQFSLSEPPHVPEIEGDAARLTQVLNNLIVNASKYSPIGSAIELQLVPRADTLYVVVADQGPGIPSAERTHLFRSFVRLGTGEQEKYGVGLGLYVVKTIVEAHGGSVGVDDRPSGGALFWFEIPWRQTPR